MKTETISASLKSVYDRLQDDESRSIFMARVNYFYTGDKRYLYDLVESSVLFGVKRKPKFKRPFPVLEDFINVPNYKEKEVVLYGAGFGLPEMYPLLDRFCLNICATCDRDPEKQGGKIYGHTVISPETLMEEHKDCYIIITAWFAAGEIACFLEANGFSRDRIIFPYDSHNVYFGPDFIQPEDNEVYIDVGAFDALTIKQFIQFCDADKKTYRKILALEPDETNFACCVCRLASESHYKNVDLINKGAYSSSGTVCFDTNTSPGGRQIDENGQDTIETVAIDELTGGDKVTFIKMDIEGAELEALKGASTTIRRDKPRLAISIYHKPEDIIDILSYINRMVPEYRFWIRHYSSIYMETVLYAVI